MDMRINITGASQKTSEEPGGWVAYFVCHRCGEVFAYSHAQRTEKEAAEESLTAFDRQQRRYCDRCGYKLTDKPDVPESEYIATLNATIDKLEADIRRLKDRIKEMEAPE